MSMQSLKKIGQKLLKLESGNEALTDGRMDRPTLKIFGGYNIILFVWWGIIKRLNIEILKKKKKLFKIRVVLKFKLFGLKNM